MGHGFIHLTLCLEGNCVWLHSLLFGKPACRLFVALLDFKWFCTTLFLHLRRKVERCSECSAEGGRNRGGL